ncbi:hypothetical protein Tco_0205152 [Tanacetum coccineum]
MAGDDDVADGVESSGGGGDFVTVLFWIGLSEVKGIPDESDRFMMDPIGFVSKSTKKWSKASHIIVFESEENHLKEFLLSQSFEEFNEGSVHTIDSSVSNSGLKDSHQWVNSLVSLFSIEPSACILFIELAEFDAAMKHMASKFSKLDKFERVDFRRWQKKMHFLLSSMSVVYVLTTPILEDGGDNPIVEQNLESSKELWDSLKAKYMAEDASSKSFLVSNFTNYKMIDSRLVLEQYNELLGSNLRIEESFRVQDSNKPKGNNVTSPSVVNMVEHHNSSKYNDNKGKRC